MLGKVKWFNNEKGYGFIKTDLIKDDILVHHSEIIMIGYRTLEAGQDVSFELDYVDSKGFQAKKVIKVN